MSNPVYLGWDTREFRAWDVANWSLDQWNPTSDLRVVKLDAARLRDAGLLTRPVDRRNGKFDLVSGAPMSTEFAIARFATPFLAHSGWALFADCDVVFLGDVNELFDLADPRYAVMCVQHDTFVDLPLTKMDGQEQTLYFRKNWSSVMLFNCDHPANRRFTLNDLNTRTGRDLHRFYWLNDAEIGKLPPEWNWLVGIQPKPADPKIAHFTQGGPWFPDWPGAEHDDIWLDAEAGLLRQRAVSEAA